MRILCLVAGHRPVPSNIWNDGHYFSRCSNCDCEMIGRGGAWRRVPRGYKVVWRPRTAETNWTPWSPASAAAAAEGGRLSDLLYAVAGNDEPCGQDSTCAGALRSVRGSVVEGFHARAAAG